MEYELYHDESQVDGYWHGILLVPDSSRNQVLSLLAESRQNVDFCDPISFKGVHKDHGQKYDLAQSWLSIGLAALRTVAGGVNTVIFLRRDRAGKPHYRSFLGAPQLKFVLFRERDAHRLMTGHADHASKVETTFRMGLKGGLHRLGNPGAPISVSKLHFDGHEHLKRHVSKERIVGRLEGLRDYCAVATGDGVIDDRSSDPRSERAQSYEDCQLLQLTDLLVGACPTAICGGADWHEALAVPVGELIDKYLEGPARMAKSRWRDAFCMSECYLEGGKWQFAIPTQAKDDHLNTPRLL